MQTSFLRTLLVVALCCAHALAQEAVTPDNLHERIIVVVPIVGKGTYDDPKRPLFAPDAQEKESRYLQYSWQPSDDGRLAVVEFVALDRKALMPILSDARTVKGFLKGRDKKADIERELRVFRNGLSLEKRGAR